MLDRATTFTACILMGLCAHVAAADPSIAQHVPEFHLPTMDGNSVKLQKTESHAFTVVCFLGTECPLAKLYGPRLASLSRKLASRGVRFVGVNSNHQDSIEEVRVYAKAHGIDFPMAKDYGNAVADEFSAKRTPEVFVVDNQLEVRYRGRIDDQYSPGMARPAPGRHDLQIALDELLSHQAVTNPFVKPEGCLIGRVKKPHLESSVVYTDQIARLFQRHCIECHRKGGIGPFELTQYEEAVGWAETLVEVVDERRMPPWHANPRYGRFANARHMPEEDKQLLRAWVAAGTPFGDPAKLPKPLKFVDGWSLPREPDLVLSMCKLPFDVPKDGTVEYQYFVVDPGFQEDKWVIAAEVIPGNRSVVHHSIVFIRPPDGSEFRGAGWLAAYVPGQQPNVFLPGHARKVPARSKLVFQQHYTPIGTPQEDITKIGIIFGDETDVTHEVYTLLGIDQDFEIPPHSVDYPVRARVRGVPQQGLLLTIVPHMHLRGKSFQLFANAENKRRTLLDVPRYDFNWQHSYRLLEPIHLSELDELEFLVTFDNSAANFANPDPEQHVSWGDQTWEEMAVAFFDVAVPRGADGERKRESVSGSAANARRVGAFVDKFFERFDADGDGIVARAETPRAMRFGFRRYDTNSDRELSRKEVAKAARQRLLP